MLVRKLTLFWLYPLTGTPPEKFNYEYYNKEKAYKSFGLLSPQEFYNQHVRPLFDVNDKVFYL